MLPHNRFDEGHDLVALRVVATDPLDVLLFFCGLPLLAFHSRFTDLHSDLSANPHVLLSGLRVDEGSAVRLRILPTEFVAVRQNEAVCRVCGPVVIPTASSHGSPKNATQKQAPRCHFRGDYFGARPSSTSLTIPSMRRTRWPIIRAMPSSCPRVMGATCELCRSGSRSHSTQPPLRRAGAVPVATSSVGAGLTGRERPYEGRAARAHASERESPRPASATAAWARACP